jgi:hypothetical protein
MKKIGLLCLALVLALGSLGVGYAMWFEDLYIDGTVDTGTLDVEWSIHGYGDDETKDYSDCYAYIVGSTLYVEITNAYPCINYYVDFDIHNNGTIPVHVCQLVCTGPAQFPGTCTITQPTPMQIHPCEEALGTISIHLDNAYDPQENTRYTFSCDLKAVQYNEACP